MSRSRSHSSSAGFLSSEFKSSAMAEGQGRGIWPRHRRRSGFTQRVTAVGHDRDIAPGEIDESRSPGDFVFVSGLVHDHHEIGVKIPVGSSSKWTQSCITRSRYLGTAAYSST